MFQNKLTASLNSLECFNCHKPYTIKGDFLENNLRGQNEISEVYTGVAELNKTSIDYVNDTLEIRAITFSKGNSMLSIKLTKLV